MMLLYGWLDVCIEKVYAKNYEDFAISVTVD